MSDAWDEAAARKAIAIAIRVDGHWSEYDDEVNAIMAALAPHLAARDAAVRRETLEEAVQKCEALAHWADRHKPTMDARAWARAAESLAGSIRALATDATP